jgi:hypothetical protein
VEREYTPDDYLVVIPSIRPVNPEYLEALKGFDIFICDDSDGKVDRRYITEKQYERDGFSKIYLGDQAMRDRLIPKGKEHLFARHCPSVKSLGLYFAWKGSYKAVILIDDDVDTRRVSPEDFMVIKRPRYVGAYSNESGWLNTITILKGPDTDIYARGYPYEFRGEDTIQLDHGTIYSLFNEGLWMGTPDINGVDKLEMSREMCLDHNLWASEDPPWYIDPGDYSQAPDVLIGQGQHLPLSIMNVQMDTSLIPAFYQPPDYRMYRSYKIRRHDDIWSCYFLKAVMDYLDLPMTAGSPILWHRKAGDPISEVLSEHHTNLIQPHITRTIDRASELLLMDGRTEDIAEISEALAILAVGGMDPYPSPSRWHTVMVDYFKACREWAQLFQ